MTETTWVELFKMIAILAGIYFTWKTARDAVKKTEEIKQEVDTLAINGEEIKKGVQTLEIKVDGRLTQLLTKTEEAAEQSKKMAHMAGMKAGADKEIVRQAGDQIRIDAARAEPSSPVVAVTTTESKVIVQVDPTKKDEPIEDGDHIRLDPSVEGAKPA